MIRGFVTIALSGALLAMAAPAQAEKAPPRPARSSATRPAAPAPNIVPTRTARDETREASATRAARPGLELPHPFREQVLPEGRV